MRRGRRHSNDDSLGCLVYVLLGIFLMPIVGLVFVCGKDPEKKTIGWVLLVAGVILWIALGIGSG